MNNEKHMLNPCSLKRGKKVNFVPIDGIMMTQGTVQNEKGSPLDAQYSRFKSLMQEPDSHNMDISGMID